MSDTATRYGIRTEYETRTERRDYLSAWSGPFMSVYEAQGYANNGAKTYSMTDYNGDRIAAKLPEGITAPRTDQNFMQIDAAISDALNAHNAAKGRATA